MEDGRKLQYVVTCAVSILTTTMGFINAWATSMVRKFWLNETDFKLSDDDEKWFFKITPIGLVVGTVLGGYICDRFGRRTSLLFSIVVSVIGSIFAALSSASWMLLVMQFQWTFSLGIVWNVVSVYMAEVIDPDIRGGLTVSTTFMFHVGSLLMIWIGGALSYRALNNWIIVAPLLSFASIYPIPESPYYLLKMGKEAEARRELSRLQENVGIENIDTQFEKMKMHVEVEMQNPSSFLKFLIDKRYRKALIITFGLHLLYIVLSGLTIIPLFFLTFILEGNIQLNPRYMVDIGVGIRAGIGILAALLVDRLGRRFLLLSSFIGSSISMAVIGLYFAIRDYYTEWIQAIGYIPFGAVIILLISYSLASSIQDVIVAELFPLNVRVMAVVSLYAFGQLSYPLGIAFIELWHSAGRVSVFWTFTIVTCIAFVFTYYILPETKRKSLKEIQIMLRGEDSDYEMTTRNVQRL